LADFVVVENYTNVMRAFAKADRQLKNEWRRELRAVGEPVASESQLLAVSTIPNMSRSPQWARMRVGVTQKETYVVPRQRGVRGHGPKRRPNLANLMLDRAMRPALSRNRDRVVARFGQALDRICADFNRSP
jgi:hypothetical protein